MNRESFVDFVEENLLPPSAPRVVVCRSATPELTANFYRTLGLRVSPSGEFGEEGWLLANCFGLLLKFAPATENDSVPSERRTFLVDDVNETIGALEVAGGVIVEDIAGKRGPIRAIVADPDGSEVVLVERSESRGKRGKRTATKVVTSDSDERAAARYTNSGIRAMSAAEFGAFQIGVEGIFRGLLVSVGALVALVVLPFVIQIFKLPQIAALVVAVVLGITLIVGWLMRVFGTLSCIHDRGRYGYGLLYGAALCEVAGVLSVVLLIVAVTGILSSLSIWVFWAAIALACVAPFGIPFFTAFVFQVSRSHELRGANLFSALLLGSWAVDIFLVTTTNLSRLSVSSFVRHYGLGSVHLSLGVSILAGVVFYALMLIAVIRANH